MAMTSKGTWPRVLLVVLALAVIAAAVFVTVRLAYPPPATPVSATESSEGKSGDGSSSSSDPSQAVHAGAAGHVRDAAGAGVGGAIVCASQTVCVTAGDDGAYAFDDLPSDTALFVVASASGRHPSEPVRVKLGVGEHRAGVDLVLAGSGVATRGRVKDALGGVIAGASVVFTLGENRGAIVATSDTRGEFSAFVGTGYLSVIATSPGYASAAAYGQAPDRFFELSLVPGAVILGRAIDRANGTGVAAAKVDAVALDGGRRRTVTSADDGSFRIDGLSPGRYHLEGLAPQLSGYSKTPVLLSVGETASDVVVELEHSPSVSGRVVESKTRAPCPGGEVTLRDKRNDEFAHAPIESDGTVKMIAVLPGNYDVEVQCTDHASGRKKLAPVIVRDRAIEGLEWEVERGTQLSGVVVDADGKPVANAEVEANPESYEDGGSGEARTDARGKFVIKGLGAAKYNLIAKATGATPATQPIELGHRDEENVRLTLGRGASVAGRVTDVGGEPVAGATVHLSGPMSLRLDTGPDGTFTTSSLTPGEYRVGVSVDDAPRRSLRRGYTSHHGKSSTDHHVTVKEGETARTALVIERRADAIEGVVVDGKGVPLSDYFVEAQRIESVRASASKFDSMASGAVTDSMGRFKIEKLGAGEYTLRAFRPGGAMGVIAKTTAGAKAVTVKVVSGAVTGVVTARGARSERFHVTLNGPAHRGETMFYTNGVFTMKELPPGDYEVNVRSSEGTATTKVTVKEDATASVKLSLEREVEATD